jgi:hypothetical protein
MSPHVSMSSVLFLAMRHAKQSRISGLLRQGHVPDDVDTHLNLEVSIISSHLSTHQGTASAAYRIIQVLRKDAQLDA